jgi:hypothetical protein
MDERGARYIVDDPDDPYWGEGGHGREPVLAEFPNPNPPKPFTSFQTYAAANGFDF